MQALSAWQHRPWQEFSRPDDCACIDPVTNRSRQKRSVAAMLAYSHAAAAAATQFPFHPCLENRVHRQRVRRYVRVRTARSGHRRMGASAYRKCPDRRYRVSGRLCTCRPLKRYADHAAGSPAAEPEAAVVTSSARPVHDVLPFPEGEASMTMTYNHLEGRRLDRVPRGRGRCPALSISAPALEWAGEQGAESVGGLGAADPPARFGHAAGGAGAPRPAAFQHHSRGRGMTSEPAAGATVGRPLQGRS